MRSLRPHFGCSFHVKNILHPKEKEERPTFSFQKGASCFPGPRELILRKGLAQSKRKSIAGGR